MIGGSVIDNDYLFVGIWQGESGVNRFADELFLFVAGDDQAKFWHWLTHLWNEAKRTLPVLRLKIHYLPRRTGVVVRAVTLVSTYEFLSSFVGNGLRILHRAIEASAQQACKLANIGLNETGAGTDGK